MQMTPYEQMLAEKEIKRQTTGGGTVRKGRKPLADEQRQARKVADRLAARRAYYVLKDRYRQELNEIAKAERHALYALIDSQFAAGQPIVLPEK